MPSHAMRIVAGFLSGVLAILIFHQGAYLVMAKLGIPLQGKPWDLAPDASAYGLPRLANQCFWGGLWGILLAYMWSCWENGPGWLKGFIFGCIFPLLIGSWLLVSLIKGRPVFNGFLTDYNVLKLRTGFLLNGVAFGLGLGIIYPLLAGMFGGTRRETR